MDREAYLSEMYSEDDKILIALFTKEANKLKSAFWDGIKKKDTKTLIKNLNASMKNLNDAYKIRTNKRIPQEYYKGGVYMNDVLNGTDSLIGLGNFTEKEILNKIKMELWPAHIEAVESLMNTSRNYVKVAVNSMETEIITMVGKFHQEKIKEEIAGWMLTWRSDIKTNLIKYFQENSILQLKDRAGRKRDYKRYIDMITRTETSIANVQGTINRALQLGATKFKIYENAGCCSHCAVYNGTIVDIKNGMVELPPFHPNCRGFISSVLEDETTSNINT